MQGGPEQVALRFVGIQEAPTNGAVIEFVFARADGTEVRKRLAHLRRFATHLRERIVADGVPELPRVDDAVSPDDCEALARVASQLLATGALADTDAEWLLFAHSTTIQPGGAWDVSAAPKMRTVTVDITVMGGRALRGGPLDSLWTVGSDPHKYVAVVTHKEQRYCTAIVEELHGNPQWGEEGIAFTPLLLLLTHDLVETRSLSHHVSCSWQRRLSWRRPRNGSRSRSSALAA